MSQSSIDPRIERVADSLGGWDGAKGRTVRQIFNALKGEQFTKEERESAMRLFLKGVHPLAVSVLVSKLEAGL